MTDIIGEILKRISETKKEIADTVAAGHGVNSFEIYQRLIGRAEGLQISLDLINDVLTVDDNNEQ